MDRPAGVQRSLPFPQGGLPAAHRAVLREVGLVDHRDVALRAHHPHLRAVRGRHRTHALPALPGVERRRWPRLGADLHLGGLLLRQHSADQEQFRPGDHRHHRGVADPGGVGGAEETARVSAGYRSFAHRVDIDVPVERVWRALTEGRLLARWAAAEATIAPREKGRLHLVFGADVELDAHIDVLITPQRLRLILLPTPGMPSSDAVIVEDFLFERGKNTTLLRLLSSGVPSA